MQKLLLRAVLLLFCCSTLVVSESKNCDPKKDSGCMKFTRPFYPEECWAAFPGGPNCTRFDPMKSKTLNYVDHGMFLLQYADNSALKGYEAHDVVQLGDFYTYTKFGRNFSSESFAAFKFSKQLPHIIQVASPCATHLTSRE
jgi:hypothetical protein